MDLLTPELGLFFWTLVAFLAVLFILRKFAWGPIISSLGDREKGIAESIATAERVRNEMSQLKAENEKLLAQAREERAAIIKEAKEARDKMINEAREEAKIQAAKIIQDANSTASNQKMAAMVELKNQIGKLVIEVSEKVLRRELGNKNDQENYIKQLSDDIRLN